MAGCPTIIVVATEVPDGTAGAGVMAGLAGVLSQVALSGLPWVVVTTPSLMGALRQQVGGEGKLVCAMADRLAQGSFGSCIASAVLARPQSPGWVVLPCSMPKIRPSTLKMLADQLAVSSMVFPHYKGLPGFPVGFGPEFFSELIALQMHERGTQRLLARYPGHAVDVEDPEVLRHGWGGASVSTRHFFEGVNAHQGQ
jgi:molybdenum cofactor cytidylyltransferase